MESLLVFFIGASGYGLLEIIWRGYTHWTMLITGGLCLLLLYNIFGMLKRSHIAVKCLIGGLVITTAELIAGMIVNVRFGMEVWDYSQMPMNLYGQICPMYSFLWSALCLPLVFLCGRIKSFVKKYEQ